MKRKNSIMEHEQETRNSYIIANDIGETERLKRQGRFLSKPSVMSLVPEGFNGKGKRILDLACGAGEWASMVASKFPQSEVFGVDINKDSIDYANSVSTQENLEYQDMDILQPLEFLDDSFDLVNARLIFGVVPASYWPTLLAEIYRVLKPGGIIRLVEHGASIMENAPYGHQFGYYCSQALFKRGKTFSSYEAAVIPALMRLVPAAGFINAHPQIALLDYSAGTPLHRPIVDDFIDILDRLKPLIVSEGILSAEAYGELCVNVRNEMNAPDWSATWLMYIEEAVKPE
jgi:ubiquinone/menaquinone biosynthesis C-methylase UbiE